MQGGIMERFSLREAVEQALQTEKLGYEFYRAVAEKFKEDSGMRELCETLAEKERIHEKTFSGLMETVKDAGAVDWEEVSKYLRAIVESEFFLGKEKSLPSLDQVKTVADAVKFAIGFEKETLLYFYGIRDFIKEKEVLSRIIEEEKSHIVWLNGFELSATK
jgi:rubrerythrin